MKEENLVEEDRATLSRSAGLVTAATAVSRITGLIGVLVIAGALGFTRLQDSYNLANVMPNMIFELIAGGILTSVLIPVFVTRRLQDEQQGWRAANNIANITLLILIIIATLGTIFSYYFVRAQTFLVPTHQVSIARLNFFFKFFIWEIVFYGLTTILNGILQSYRRFTMPALAPIFNNLIVIATVLFFYLPLKNTHPDLALTALAIGTALGIAAMALIQLPSLIKLGWKYQFVIDLHDPAFRQLVVLALPVVVYVAGNQIGLTVSNALAWKFKGGMTAFKIAWSFFQLPYALLAVSVSTVLFPRFSERAALRDTEGFKKTLTSAVNSTAFIIIPASMALFLLSKPIISLIFLGSYGQAGVNQVSGVMAYFMAGLLPFSAFMLLNRVFYALKDTKTPMLVNTIGIPLNIGFDFLLVAYFGVAGLSMGHSLTYLITMTILLFALRKRLGALNGRAMFKGALKFTLISAAMAVIIALLVRWLSGVAWGHPYGETAIIAAATVAGGGFYLLVNQLTGTEEVGFLSTMIRGILRKSEVAAPAKDEG
ncbi:MAG: murein biosynthesis integral membrane protein MurJ [Actinomycetota bacterium]|nr:murein biosynthesis integral membrane protein MurJ [Actinomycetota bacterium]